MVGCCTKLLDLVTVHPSKTNVSPENLKKVVGRRSFPLASFWGTCPVFGGV